MTDTVTVTVASLSLAWATTPVEARVRDAIDAHYVSLWRFLRRMGVDEHLVEDAAQQVLVVFAQRADTIAPGVVSAFLFGTALRVASDFRRRREPAVPLVDLETLEEGAHPAPDAEGARGPERAPAAARPDPRRAGAGAAGRVRAGRARGDDHGRGRAVARHPRGFVTGSSSGVERSSRGSSGG